MQRLEGNPKRGINVQWGSTPEWLPSVTVNQQVNHFTTSTDRAEEIPQLIDGQTRRLNRQPCASRDHQHLATIRASCPMLPETTQRSLKGAVKKNICEG
jgi:hypothetical protein